MSDVLEFTFESKDRHATEAFAVALGSRMRGGEIIELIGDVGAGKTTFVRGFARGAGSTSRVSSPTFTVSNVYDAPHLTIHHYDFYRLDDLKIIESELQEVSGDKKNVAILEWAEALQSSLPLTHISIYITVTGNDTRAYKCVLPKQYAYLKENI